MASGNNGSIIVIGLLAWLAFRASQPESSDPATALAEAESRQNAEDARLAPIRPEAAEEDARRALNRREQQETADILREFRGRRDQMSFIAPIGIEEQERLRQTVDAASSRRRRQLREEARALQRELGPAFEVVGARETRPVQRPERGVETAFLRRGTGRNLIVDL